MRFTALLVALTMLSAAACVSGGGTAPLLYPVRAGLKWGYIDKRGEIVIQPRFDHAGEFADGLAPVKLDGKAGYIDRTGGFAIEPRFDGCDKFSEGIALVRLGDESAYINQSGDIIYGPDPQAKEPFNSGLGRIGPPAHSRMADVVQFINRRGKVVLSLDRGKWHELGAFGDGMAAFKRGGLWGYIDTRGREVIPPRFNSGGVGVFSDGLAWAPDGERGRGEYMFIDKAGKPVFHPDTLPWDKFSDSMIPCRHEDEPHGFGYLNKRGEWLSDVRYDWPAHFSEGHALAWRDGKTYVIDKRGNETPAELEEYQYNPYYQTLYDLLPRVGPFRGGVAAVSYKPCGAFINPQGEVLQRYDGVKAWCGSAASHNELLCLRDRALLRSFTMDGRCGVDPSDRRPAALGPFSEGFAPARVNDDWLNGVESDFIFFLGTGHSGFLSESGDEFVKCEYEDALYFSEGLIPIKRWEGWGYADKRGATVIEPRWSEAMPFYEGLAAVMRDRKWGFIDRQGKEICELKYERAGSFSEGLAAVGANGLRGYVAADGVEVIEPAFEDARGFSQGLAAVRLNGKWGYIDKRGDWVIEPSFDAAYSFSEDLALVGAMSEEMVASGAEPWRIKRGVSDNVDRYSWTGYLPAETKGCYWFIDRRGERVLSEEDYCFAGSFHEGLAPVVRHRPRDWWMSGDEEACWDYIDKTGAVVTELGLGAAGDFKDGRAFVILPGQTCYINTKGEFVWPLTY